MKKLSALALIAALAAGGYTAASAQDAGADAAAQGAAGVEADALALATQYTYDDVRAALEGAADLDLSAITDETEIEIVPISDIAGDDDATAFITGEADLAGPISEIQTAIQGNAPIEAALQEAGYTAEQVIAVSIGSDTSVVVFVDDGMER